MNRTNFMHALYALAIQVGVAAVQVGLLDVAFRFGFQFPTGGMAVAFGLWTGAAAGIAWFISREHAHRQNDIADITGIPVPRQNPIDGFLGWSLDAKLDALFPFIVCSIVAIAATVFRGL